MPWYDQPIVAYIAGVLTGVALCLVGLLLR